LALSGKGQHSTKGEQMRKITIALTAVFIGLMATNLWAADPPAAPKPITIKIDNFRFTPKELTVPIGATVTWVNDDDVPHTATSKSDPPAFDSKALDTDQTFSFKFTRPGTYKYFCKLHTHMTGTVIVK
jgi:plastocyanin